MSTARYVFRAGGDESHWASIRRLADEVGWTIRASWLSRWRLRRRRQLVVTHRAAMTRSEFVHQLAAQAHADNVQFYAPPRP